MKWFTPTLYSLLMQSNFFIRRYIYTFINNNKNFMKWNVLDFWCWESPYKEMFSYKKYYWLDIWESWHDNSKNNDIIFFDWKKIPFDDDFFDSFICTEVFEHVFNIDDILQEINRVMKKWSVWIITAPFFIEEHEKPYDFARYTSFWIKHILESHWFKVLKTEKSGSYWKVVIQWLRNYLWYIFSSKIKVINIILKILLIPFHVLFILIFTITPNKNTDLYFNNLVIVEKI